MKLFEDLMKIIQIIVGIWVHLFYYFFILGDVALNYHPTKYGDSCETHVEI